MPFKNVSRHLIKLWKVLRHLLDFQLGLFLVATELLQVLPDWSVSIPGKRSLEKKAWRCAHLPRESELLAFIHKEAAEVGLSKADIGVGFGVLISQA